MKSLVCFAVSLFTMISIVSNVIAREYQYDFIIPGHPHECHLAELGHLKKESPIIYIGKTHDPSLCVIEIDRMTFEDMFEFCALVGFVKSHTSESYCQFHSDPSGNYNGNYVFLRGGSTTCFYSCKSKIR